MTDRPISRARGRLRPAVAGGIAALLVLIGLGSFGSIGRTIYWSGAVVAALLAFGRWRAVHGVAASLVVVLLVQPILAEALGPPVRRATANTSSVIRTDVPGVRDGSRSSTDASGFRPTADSPPDDATRRVVLVGGSTFQQGAVDDRATTGWLVADGLQDDGPVTEVINTGIAGLRSFHHYGNLLHYIRTASQFDETHFIIMMGINDWNYHVRTDVLGLPPSGPNHRPLLAVDDYPAVNLAQILKRILIERPGSDSDGVTVYEQPEMGQYDRLPKVDVSDQQLEGMLTKYRASIAQLVQACDSDPRIRCTFLTQPTLYRLGNLEIPSIRNSLWLHPPRVDVALSERALVAVSSAFNGTLMDEVRTAGCSRCSVIDADAALEGRPEFFYDDCHFTEAGAAALADLILASLE